MKNSNQTSGTVNINVAYNGSRPRVRISFNWSNIWQSIVSGISSFFKLIERSMVCCWNSRNVVALNIYAILWICMIAVAVHFGMERVELFRNVGVEEPAVSFLVSLWNDWKEILYGFSYVQQIGLLLLFVMILNVAFIPAEEWMKASMSILHNNNWKLNASWTSLTQTADALVQRYNRFTSKVTMYVLGVSLLTATVYFVWHIMQTAM